MCPKVKLSGRQLEELRAGKSIVLTWTEIMDAMIGQTEEFKIELEPPTGPLYDFCPMETE